MVCFMTLLAAGIVMVFYGPDLWLKSGFGKYLRSVRLWATQAFCAVHHPAAAASIHSGQTDTGRTAESHI